MARTRHRKAQQVPTRRLILDSGAVIVWARGDARARALLARALEVGLDVRIPVACSRRRCEAARATLPSIASATLSTSSRQTNRPPAGALLGQTGGTNTVDALVAAEAVITAADVLTTDADDLRALLPAHPAASVIPL